MDAFKDKDCDINLLKNETVAIFGYGIQGRAQALNLRDSGVNVLVYNRGDKYLNAASEDGFDILPPKEVVRKSSIILMLIPDQAQKDVFDQHIAPNIQSGTMLVVAHGYSIRFGGLQFPDHVDVILLAPRFPGDVLRDNYLKDKGTLAFFDVHQHAKKKVPNTDPTSIKIHSKCSPTFYLKTVLILIDFDLQKGAKS